MNIVSLLKILKNYQNQNQIHEKNIKIFKNILKRPSMMKKVNIS